MKISNDDLKAKCSLLLKQIAEKLQKETKLFALLKSYPIVMKAKTEASGEQIIALEPHTRYPLFFKQKLISELQKEHRFVRLNFDCLTKENLLQCLKQNCVALQISSHLIKVQDHDFTQSLNFETDLGVLDTLSLDTLKSILCESQFPIFPSLVVITIPESVKLAEIFYIAGAPHVVYFS